VKAQVISSFDQSKISWMIIRVIAVYMMDLKSLGELLFEPGFSAIKMSR
jgi:hypothetical protein